MEFPDDDNLYEKIKELGLEPVEFLNVVERLTAPINDSVETKLSGAKYELRKEIDDVWKVTNEHARKIVTNELVSKIDAIARKVELARKRYRGP